MLKEERRKLDGASATYYGQSAAVGFLSPITGSHEVNYKGKQQRKGKMSLIVSFCREEAESYEVSIPVGVFKVGPIGEPLSCPETFCLGGQVRCLFIIRIILMTILVGCLHLYGRRLRLNSF